MLNIHGLCFVVAEGSPGTPLSLGTILTFPEPYRLASSFTADSSVWIDLNDLMLRSSGTYLQQLTHNECDAH